MAETVPVPWSVVPGYHCFGCSPHNRSGLGLSFTGCPEGLRAAFRLGRAFESYPGVVHGGLVGVIADETMGNLVVLARRQPAWTVTQRTRFLTPLLVDHDYRCVASLSGAEPGQPLRAEAEILDADGAVCATSTAVYQPFTLAGARDRLSLGDDEIALLEHALTTTKSPFPNGVPS